jgi:uncharacterized protein
MVPHSFSATLLFLAGCGWLDAFDGEYSLEEIQAVADRMADEQPGPDAACADGDAEACGRIGVQLVHGTWGHDKDPAAAIPFLQRSGDGGHDYGCHDLGVSYMYGRGVAVDFARARALFEKTCPPIANSCHYLGAMTTQGQGAVADPVAARRWFRLACDNGSKGSCDR